MPCGIIQYQRRPPTPFDINQLHLIVTLSRQRSGVSIFHRLTFEADRFNHSRTYPEAVVTGQLIRFQLTTSAFIVADQYGSRTENNKTPIDERRTANDRFSRLPLRSRPHILN